jgi:hypothetical protein
VNVFARLPSASRKRTSTVLHEPAVRRGSCYRVADGSRPADTLLTLANGDAWPTSVSSDGAWLAWCSTGSTKCGRS